VSEIPGNHSDRTGLAVWQFWLWGLIALAMLWRLLLATWLPILSRDGAQFCWYAQHLADEGLTYLQSPLARQHPLYPMLIMLVQRGLGGVGCSGPESWQWAGQAVSLVSGLCVVLLTIRITAELIRQLELPLDPRLTGMVAGVLCAWMPLHTHLSVDVLSDELHLAFYLLGIDQMLRLRDWRAAVGAGFAAGLAFWVRPEGGAIALGAGSALLALRNVLGWRKLLVRAALLGVSLCVCVGAYWLLTGNFSAKKNPLPWMVGEKVVQRDAGVLEVELAKLEMMELPPPIVPLSVVYQMGRAGRIVVPLLGILGLWHVRRKLLGAVLIGPLSCAVIHFSLLVVLQSVYHYLAPRHTLVLVALLTPLGAIALVEGLRRLSAQRAVQVGIIAAIALPLCWYNLRLPNGADRYIRGVARWMIAHDDQIAQRRVMTGSGLLRVAFYSGAVPVQWHENDQTSAEQIATQMLGERADYFLIETGPGFEREGNQARITALLEESVVRERLELVQTLDVGSNVKLLVFRLLPS
jgi:hypothetical protein